MASGFVEPIASIRTGSVSGITSSSTQSLADLGIIPDIKGMYVLFLQTDYIYNSGTASAYIVYRLSTLYAVTPIVEGSASTAPRIEPGNSATATSNGILKTLSSSTGSTIYYAILKIS